MARIRRNAETAGTKVSLFVLFTALLCLIAGISSIIVLHQIAQEPVATELIEGRYFNYARIVSRPREVATLAGTMLNILAFILVVPCTFSSIRKKRPTYVAAVFVVVFWIYCIAGVFYLIGHLYSWPYLPVPILVIATLLLGGRFLPELES